MTDDAVLAEPTHREIRAELLQLVVADLHGPLGGPEEEFSTRENPIDRYPLGRLAPMGETVTPETHEELSEGGSEDAEEGSPEPTAPALPSLHPSAQGFTALVDGGVDRLVVRAKWGRYERGESEREELARRGQAWRRQQLGGNVTIPLAEGLLEPKPLNEEQPEIVVRGRARRYEGNWLVTLFLENRHHAAPGSRDAIKWIFQAELSAAGPDGSVAFLARDDRVSGGDDTDQREQRQLAMAYRRHREFAVGCGTAVRVEGTVEQDRAERITTCSVGQHEIPTTAVPSANEDADLPELADLELRMERLAELADGASEDLADVASVSYGVPGVDQASGE